MEDWDRLAIDFVKNPHVIHNAPDLFWKLVHIHELIWWCMDIQREYRRSTEDRKMIGLITAVLNDVRDEIKCELGCGERKQYGNPQSGSEE